MSRHFWLDSGGDLKLRRLSLVNGFANFGGSLAIVGDSRVAMEDCMVSESSASGMGGAAYLFRGSLELNNTLITRCEARHGGGVYSEDGFVVLRQSNVTYCKANDGGDANFRDFNGGCVNIGIGDFEMYGGELLGCRAGPEQGRQGLGAALCIMPPRVTTGGLRFLETARIELAGIEITDAYTAYDGGGIYALRSVTLYLRDSVIRGCRAAWGAALYGESGGAGAAPWMYVLNSHIIDNHATLGGGAMDSYGANFAFSDTLVEDCTSLRDGGAMYPNGGSFKMTDCNITNSTAGRFGGGIIATGSVAVVLRRLVIRDCVATGMYDGSGGGGGFRGTGGTPTLIEVEFINCMSFGAMGGAAISSSVHLNGIGVSIVHSCATLSELTPSIIQADAGVTQFTRAVAMQLVGCPPLAVEVINAEFSLCNDLGVETCGAGATCSDRPIMASAPPSPTSPPPTAIACTCEGAAYPNKASSMVVALGSPASLAAYDSGCLTVRRATSVAQISETVRMSLTKQPGSSWLVNTTATIFVEGTDAQVTSWSVATPSKSWLMVQAAGYELSSIEPQQSSVFVQADVSGLPERLEPYVATVVVAVDSMLDSNFTLPISLSVTARTHLPASTWSVANRENGISPCTLHVLSEVKTVFVGEVQGMSFQACDTGSLPVDHQIPSSSDSRTLSINLVNASGAVVVSESSTEVVAISYSSGGAYAVTMTVPTPGEFSISLRASNNGNSGGETTAPQLHILAVCPSDRVDIDGRCVCMAGLEETLAKPGVCSPCAMGTYKPLMRQDLGTTCKMCPEGSTSPVSSTSVVDCVCAGTFSQTISADGTAKCECDAGKEIMNGVRCDDCQPGMYKPASGNSKCFECYLSPLPLAAKEFTTTMHPGSKLATDCVCKVAHINRTRRQHHHPAASLISLTFLPRLLPSRSFSPHFPPGGLLCCGRRCDRC